MNDGMSTDYENRCGNCQEEMNPYDKYCRNCGTKRGEGKFEPYYNVCDCLYGPFNILRKYVCKKCGNEWERSIVFEDKFCPKCGEKCVIEKTRDTTD